MSILHPKNTFRLRTSVRQVLCYILVAVLPCQVLFADGAEPAPAAASNISSLPTVSMYKANSRHSTTHFRYPPFLIGPGDTVDVMVFGESDLSGGGGGEGSGNDATGEIGNGIGSSRALTGASFLVDSEGTIVYPLVGTIELGGLTQVQASQALSNALSKFIVDPQVTVSVADSAQYTVSVMGNVVKPGKYLIRGLPTLLGALAEAGGPLPYTALNSTVLIRHNRTYKVPLGLYFKPSRDVEEQPLILPGDVIYVPASLWPTWGEWGIIASLLSSAAVLAAELSTLRR